MKFTGTLKGRIEIPFTVEADSIEDAKTKALEIPAKPGYKIEYIREIGSATPTPVEKSTTTFTPAPPYKPSEWELRGDHSGTFE